MRTTHDGKRIITTSNGSVKLIDIENLRTAVTDNISLIWEQLGKLKYVCSVRAYYADSPVYENIGYIGTYDGEYYIYDGLYGGEKLDMSKFPEPVYP